MKKKIRVWIVSLAQRSSSTFFIRFHSPFRHFPAEFEFIYVPSFRAVAECSVIPDVVIFHRILYPFEEVYKILDFCRAHTVLTGMEIDDLIIDVPPKHPSHFWHVPIKGQIEELMRKVDFITTSTERLKQFLLPYNQQIYVLPNLIDMNIWGQPQRDQAQKARQHADTVLIGYAGSLPHIYDFEFVIPAIKFIQERYKEKVGFEFFGCIPEGLKGLPGIAHRGIIESYPGYARFLRSRNFDFTIAPLVDNSFGQSKSNMKFLEYSICGYAGIYSRVGPYIDSVVHNETGLLVGNSAEEWAAAMERLIEDPGSRKRIAANSHDWVATRYSLQKRFGEWVDTYRSIVDQGGKKKDIRFSINPAISYGTYIFYAQFREIYYCLRRLWARIFKRQRR